MKSRTFFKVTTVLVGMGLALCFATACSKKADQSAAIEKYGSNTLKIYLPGEYISETLIPNFEKQFGVKVIVELFDSNEMMYAKVAISFTRGSRR